MRGYKSSYMQGTITYAEVAEYLKNEKAAAQWISKYDTDKVITQPALLRLPCDRPHGKAFRSSVAASIH